MFLIGRHHNMKHLLFIVIIVLLFLVIPIFSQSDSTRLKSYENYVLQIDTQIKDTENKILELQKYLLQLQGAKSAFEAVISDEKKYIEQKK